MKGHAILSVRALTRPGSLRGAAASGFFARSTNIAGSALILPIAASRLDATEFESALVLLTLTAFASLGDLGVGLAMLSLMPAASSPSERQRLAYTARWMTTIAACVILATGLLLSFSGLPGQILLNGNENGERLAFAVLTTTVTMSVISNLRLRLMDSLGRHVEHHIIYAGAYAIAYSVTILVLWLFPSLPLYLLMVSALPQMLIAIAAGRRVAHLLPARGGHDRKTMSTIAKTASGSAVQSVSLILAVQSDVLITSAVLGTANGAELAMANRLLSAYILLLAIMFNPLWPAFARAHADGDLLWIRRTMSKALPLGVGTAAIFAVILLSIGTPVTKWLTAGSFAPGRIMWIAGTAWCVALAAHYPLAMFVNAMAIRRAQVLSAVAMLLLNLPLTVALLHLVGPAGALFASAASYLLAICIPFAAIYRKRVRPDSSRPVEVPR